MINTVNDTILSDFNFLDWKKEGPILEMACSR